MRKPVLAVLILIAGLTACDDDDYIYYPDWEAPAAPRNVDAYYYNRAVYITWELAPSWNEEVFNVYGKRITDAEYFWIAQVTNCSEGLCSYTDVNIVAGQTYLYYVGAYDEYTGLETESDYSVEVYVPQPIPPAIPAGMEIVALDGANYLRWSDNARNADDFSFYRVYLAGADGTDYLLGETDSEGFLDQLALNGETYSYFVTSLDNQGHESLGSAVASGTPRPDFSGEWVYAYSDFPSQAGFRFEVDESVYPVVDGGSADRHFRLEVDSEGWWLVPGPGAQIFDGWWETTALKCGVGSDAGCSSLDMAPLTGYTSADMPLNPQVTYVMRVIGDDGLQHYGAMRVALLGYDQNGYAIMIFDWAYQLQAGNPNLVAAER